ncbi:hypothetical protein FOXG_18920 [Fusarium oxysporum f. sp. lycopersici 4287]|uniref:Uncharacterized protein n=2 Tax=Fusarium oxysporum TaxID=5507 RepID=A0A0J9WKA2_FUSO4|nr:hypothetical protein FOXG_18920 [Fusarium oxysporum f. sp. lycopersici 4287]EXK38617.1 hypothetical protein FOMG_06182 [Fusarium oxysporum f. sp. melonis 26406]KNB01677.1 hypothetical protein FOXG_18920 [Fusarium oxysporum f. sp. lycopersici 4287]
MTSTSAISLANRVGHDPSKPTVIGLYGLPATGKSTVLEGLRNKLGETEFAFFDGSDVISYLVHGGLKAFQKLEDPEKKSGERKPSPTSRMKLQPVAKSLSSLDTSCYGQRRIVPRTLCTRPKT